MTHMQRQILIVWLMFGSVTFAQTCDVRPPAITPKGPTIFSPEQEVYLGDVVAEQLRGGLRVYAQPELTKPLDQIAARLTRYLPADQYRFRFELIEIPQANAFALPGGRVFVSRRLVAFVENEDELAGVLAHEMGHVLARQSSVEMSRTMREVLKITSVGDRDDIFQKFNQLLDQVKRGRYRARAVDDDQLVADRISLEAVRRAGYDREDLARFLDRLVGNNGATGNILTDLLGMTRPETKRGRTLPRMSSTPRRQ